MNNKSKNQVLLSWSGGKDSALALYFGSMENHIVSLFSTMNRTHEATRNTPTGDLGEEEGVARLRLSIHGTPIHLISEQAKMINLPIQFITVDENEDYDAYVPKMESFLRDYVKKCGVKHVIFGDLFLHDLKQYRIDFLAPLGLKPLLPLWKRNMTIPQTFQDLGFKAVISCVDANLMDPKFLGREYDLDFLNDLPRAVDPCGENGEFHTFVYDGPNFECPVEFSVLGEFVTQNRYHHLDLQ